MHRVVSFGLALCLTTAASAEIVRDWRNSANYPARINGIQFETQWLRPGSPMRVGAWTIRLEPAPATARWVSEHGCTVVRIDSVVLANAVDGEKQGGAIVLRIGGCLGSEGPSCAASWFRDFRNKIEDIALPCPTALDLTH